MHDAPMWTIAYHHCYCDVFARSELFHHSNIGPLRVEQMSIERLDQFDDVPVRILDECGSCPGFRLVTRLFHHAVMIDSIERLVNVGYAHGDVIPRGSLVEILFTLRLRKL